MGASHSKLAAAARANRRFPMPARPWISQACAKRSRFDSHWRAIVCCHGRKPAAELMPCPPAAPFATHAPALRLGKTVRHVHVQSRGWNREAESFVLLPRALVVCRARALKEIGAFL